MTPPQREDFAHAIRLSVRWGDMDTLGHVNNAKFFTYEESSRIEYFQPLALEDPRMWKDYGLILASIGADFLAQVHYPSELEICTRIAGIGRSSMATLSAMFLDDQPVAIVRGTVVWFDYLAQKSAPIPETVRAWILARERVSPDQANPA
jgi:acyl-CoA thioester hydrolase